MSNKQSSVDFYAEKSLDLFNLFQQGSISINDFRARMSIIEIEVKEMHEEEIIDAWGNGWVNGDITMDNYESVAENYYSETYGGKK
jgi:hypothetical protein